VTELPSEGEDTIWTPFDLVLAATIEHAHLTGAGSSSVTGNTASNLIYGNGGDNQLLGIGGGDTLDGGAGADTLIGGQGNDLYVVDSASDSVIEADGEGVDAVSTSTNFALGAGLENLRAYGPGVTECSGNDADNLIDIGAASAVVHALKGDDTIL